MKKYLVNLLSNDNNKFFKNFKTKHTIFNLCKLKIIDLSNLETNHLTQHISWQDQDLNYLEVVEMKFLFLNCCYISFILNYRCRSFLMFDIAFLDFKLDVTI